MIYQNFNCFNIKTRLYINLKLVSYYLTDARIFVILNDTGQIFYCIFIKHFHIFIGLYDPTNYTYLFHFKDKLHIENNKKLFNAPKV